MQPDQTYNFDEAVPQPVPEVTPNHTATRPGIFARGATKQREPKPERAPRKPPPPNVPGQFVEPLTELYGAVAFVCMPFKPRVSMVIMGPCKMPTEAEPEPLSVAENCALAWDKAAQSNATIRRMLASGLTATVIGTLIAAHVPILAAALEGTSLAEKLDPTAAVEAFLKRQAERAESEE